MTDPASPRRIPVAHPDLSGNEMAYVTDCIATEWITWQGKYVGEFEQAFADWTGLPFAVSTCNGTTALHLALVAAGIGPGDEVIVPSMTYVASANAVAYTGASVVLVDSSRESMNVTPDRVAAALTPRTRAVIPVDLYGMPADVPGIRQVIPDDVIIVQDAAEALGARIDGQHVGSHADLTTFSFFGNKTLTTGEGGMVACHTSEMAERLRLLRGQGQDPHQTYFHPVLGFNYRMTNLQAAVGLAQMERIEHHLDVRSHVTNRYRALLADLGDAIHIPETPANMTHGNWMFAIIVREGGAERRDTIRRAMAEHGIETRPGFTAVHRLPMYPTHAQLPNADWISEGTICLPTHSRLTDDAVDYVAAHLRDALGA